MKTISLFTTAVLWLTAAVAGAMPTLPNKCEVFKPGVLLDNTVKESVLNEFLIPAKKKKKNAWGQDGSNTGRYWIVYSDRSSNTTYEQPGGGTACDQLEFNEKVCIASIKDDYALVYVETQRGESYPTISTRARCRGWIPMKHLLLWQECPTNEFGIYNKALIVGNIDKLKDDEHIGSYYSNPETQEGRKELHSQAHFFFVMKRDPDTGLVLLSKESNIEGKSTRENNIGGVPATKELYGWISEGMYAPWSQRTCLEPNWEEKAMADLRGTTVPVYSSATGKNSYVGTRIGIFERKNSVSGNNPATEYRMEPNTLRYPLLGNDRKADKYKITAFANLGGVSATTAMADISKAEADIQQSLDALRTVNIIVVIDGTKGMEKFFPVALEAIARANEYFGKENRNVKAGVVIYRDYADGDNVTEFLPMRRATDQSISDFLRRGGKYGVKSSDKDKTDTEALYKGLEVALDTRKMGYSKDNSNLMFVIGDCGNAPTDNQCLTPDEIVGRCVENRIQLQAFQVCNIQSKAYNMFRNQMGDIVVDNMKKQYEKLGKGIKLTYKELDNGYDAVFDVPKESTFFIGGIRNARNNQEMDASSLYALVMSTSKVFNEALDNMERTHSTEAISENALSAIDMNFLKGRVSGNSIKVLQDRKYLTAFEGFVEKASGNGRDYWQPVIYISKPELMQLMESLSPVMEVINTHSSSRKPYVDAMKALVRTMLPDVSESAMNQMSNTDIMNMITGLNVRTSALETHSLIDIQSEQKVSKQQFDGILYNFSDAYKKLERISQEKYAFSYKRNGVWWYWIPATSLP